MKAELPDTELVASELTVAKPEPSCVLRHADIHAFEQLDSTSNWLKENRGVFNEQLAKGRAQVCVTDWQQAGVGRRGKIWQTQPGNVTFSVMYRIEKPSEQLLGLSLVTGIAVAESLQRILGLDAKLKWPNDVMLHDRKLGGLLTEVLPVSETVKQATVSTADTEDKSRNKPSGFDVISGIGVNVRQDDAVRELGIGAISLAEAGFEMSQQERDSFIGTICRSLLDAHSLFFYEGWNAFSATWKRKDWLLDRKVLIHHQHSTEQAVARGVNLQGALMIERAGTLSPLYGGNVSVRPTT